MERNYPNISVTDKAARSLRSGHPWVYADEVLHVDAACENGQLVDVTTRSGHWLGAGFYKSASKIRVRVLSRNANDRFDEAFWARRIRYAVDYRRTVMGQDFDNCRLIFGEADFLPGIVIDKFSDVLVVESLALGIDRLKPLILEKLVKVLEEDGIHIRGIYERSDAKVRLQEGMERYKGFIGEPFDTKVEIVENGVRYLVDVKDGQKTGFFLDQKYNRRAVARIAAGHTVLDCFTHTGSFALNAAKGGAARVTAADISAEAIAMAQRNAQRNNLTNMDFLCEDTFELLPRLEKEGHPYDFIILDPPAFTKARRTVENAMRGYKEINYRAMKLLPRGGYLATASCSHFATEELFIKMLHAAAKDAHRQLRQIEVKQQAPDHPILWGVPETNYLKFFLFQVI